jgi:small subunit ribosomal protein S2
VARAAPEDGSGGVVRHGGTTYVTRRIGPNIGDISKTYRSQQRLDNIFDSMGSIPEKRYDPLDVLLDPPQPEDVTLEMLMAAQTHMGHHRSLWNPHNSRYIYGTRQGIHIISLEQTAAHLRRAARVIEEVAFRGGLILFVGNRKGHMPIVAKAAELAGGCQLFTKWTPGSITNRDLILGRQGLKVVDEHDQVVGGFEAHLNQMRPLVPDLVVCLNPIENFTMLYECGLKSIPTIGVIDTNANPSWVTYTIPANDDR